LNPGDQQKLYGASTFLRSVNSPHVDPEIDVDLRPVVELAD